MLKVILSDPLEFLKKNYKKYDAIIFPDYIVQRNLEISLLKDKEINEIPDNTYTLFSLTRELVGKNTYILPRFLERQIAHISINDLNYFRDLHDNEHFITDLLSEYWGIKENLLTGKKISTTSKFFELFDSNFTRLMEKLENGINIENNIMHFYPKIKIIELIKNNLDTKKFKNILFCCFYYIGPGLKKFIDEFKMEYNITMLIHSLKNEIAEFFLKRVDPDDIEELTFKMPEEIILESLPDQRREVKYIANFILDKMHSGYSSSDFTVAFPDAKQYEQFIDEIFPDYSIPYFLESRTKLIELPASNALIEKLRESTIATDIDYFAYLCNNILMNIAKENNNEEFLFGLEKLSRSIDEFKNEMKILRPFIDESSFDFIEFFVSFLSTSNFGRNFDDLNAVQIIDIGNMSMRKSKYVIIGGMRDGFYPRPYSSNIVFPEIYSNNILYYRNQEIHEKFEMYQFFASFFSAKKILITYPYLDLEGKRYLESYFIKKLEKEFKINVKRESQSASTLIFGDLAFSKKDLKISKILEGEFSETRKLEIECNEKIKNEIQKMELTPTHITTYNTCPRKFYLRYIMKIEIPVRPFSPPYMGTIVHEILREFYGKYPDLRELQRLLSNREISLKDEIENILNKMTISNDEDFLIHMETIKRDAIKSIKNDLNIDFNRMVIEREKEFSLDFSGIKIKGRIDRMDRTDNTYVLMDYKYSSIGHMRKLFITDENDLKKEERDLSLPIYILWLERNFRPQSFVAFYFPIRAKFKKQKKWLYLYTRNFRSTTPGWANYLRNNIWNDAFRNVVEKRISEIIEGIRNCEFPIIEQENVCQNCEFKLLCMGDLR